MVKEERIHKFAGYGIEIEYMLVDQDQLTAKPIADQVLTELNHGELTQEAERGDAAWSNEFALHVIELKTNGPMGDFVAMEKALHQEVQALNQMLAKKQCRLMPTAMHPLLDPATEIQLWSHGNATIYNTYDRIFGCKGHGWGNLQSVHINLPFYDDEEFAGVHAAVRLLIPLIPALAASSPIVEGVVTRALDNRLAFYLGNQKKVPAIVGQVIPEPASTRKEYEDRILKPMFKAILPHDPEGVLAYEWLNSRGAIARFDRNAIEIRVMDTQESVMADLAIVRAVVSVVAALESERWGHKTEGNRVATEALFSMFQTAMREGLAGRVNHPEYLAALGMHAPSMTFQEIWTALVDDLEHSDFPIMQAVPALRLILKHGNLSDRILRAVGKAPSAHQIQTVYAELCRCLDENRQFEV